MDTKDYLHNREKIQKTQKKIEFIHYEYFISIFQLPIGSNCPKKYQVHKTLLN